MDTDHNTEPDGVAIVTVRVPASHRKALRILAGHKDTTLSDEIREAISRHLAKDELAAKRKAKKLADQPA